MRAIGGPAPPLEPSNVTTIGDALRAVYDVVRWCDENQDGDETHRDVEQRRFRRQRSTVYPIQTVLSEE